MIDPNDIVKSMQIDSLTADEQMQLLSGIEKSIKNSRVQRQEAVKGNVDVVINLLKKIESDIRSRYDEVGNRLESHFSSMAEGKDGKDGKDGLQGAKGADGRDGVAGRDGVDGQNGQDGQDGVSVTDAKIDFDGSLVIVLSTGREINVGEVVAPELAEKIKLVTSGGGTSQQVLDTLASLQTQIDTLIPSQTGNAGKYLTTNGTTTSWADVSAGSMVYPGAGVAVSTGTAWGTSKTTPSGDLVGTTDTQTLTNKTIAFANNTLTGVQPTLVSGTSIKTINSTSLLGSGDIPLFAGGLTKIEKVSALPGSPDANTLYIVV